MTVFVKLPSLLVGSEPSVAAKIELEPPRGDIRDSLVGVRCASQSDMLID
jgi:hypothetical protein